MKHIYSLRNTRFLTGTILLIAAVLFLLLNVSSGVLFKSLRLDLTANRIYTLSPGTLQIIRQLPEPITLRFYFSKNLAKVNPYLISFASRVQDLLVQYERASKGKIKLQIIDPEPFSSTEDDAVNYGLQGVPVDGSGMELYFGIVGSNSLDAKRVIAFLQPAREVNLEYDISQLIYNLANPQPKVVGVISSLPLEGKGLRPWVIWQQMQQQFEMQPLEMDVTEIPAAITTLMLINPTTLTADALQAIDQFVRRGGHILAFVDPYSELSEQRTAANIDTLLQSWGVELIPGKVVADPTIAKPVLMQQLGRETTVRYPLWLDFTKENFDAHDVLTGSLDNITLATPGALRKLPHSSHTFTPLITTSTNAMLVDAASIGDYQQNMDFFANHYAASGAYVVAARVTGPVSNMVIVADADLLYDHFWVTMQNVMGQDFAVPNAGNGNFVLSALDNLSGSDALISIRNRGTFTRPFVKLQALESKSQDKYRESEQALLQKLEAAKQKLTQNFNQAPEEAFRQELVETRRELRDVRRKLNHDIEAVEAGVKFFAIGLIPLLIVMGGLLVWGLQIRREIKYRK